MPGGVNISVKHQGVDHDATYSDRIAEKIRRQYARKFMWENKNTPFGDVASAYEEFVAEHPLAA